MVPTSGSGNGISPQVSSLLFKYGQKFGPSETFFQVFEIRVQTFSDTYMNATTYMCVTSENVQSFCNKGCCTHIRVYSENFSLKSVAILF